MIDNLNYLKKAFKKIESHSLININLVCLVNWLGEIVQFLKYAIVGFSSLLVMGFCQKPTFFRVGLKNAFVGRFFALFFSSVVQQLALIKSEVLGGLLLNEGCFHLVLLLQF